MSDAKLRDASINRLGNILVPNESYGIILEEKIQNLIAAVERLLDQLEFPRSIAELGISREEFERAMPELIKQAFDDPSWRSNPRMPLISELGELYWKAYEGRRQPQAAGAAQQKTA